MLDDSLATLRYRKSFIGPREAGQDGQPRGISGGPPERSETVRLRVPNGFTVGVPLTIGVLRWPRSPVEFINDAVVLIPDQQMRIASNVEADCWGVIHVAFDDGVGGNGSIL